MPDKKQCIFTFLLLLLYQPFAYAWRNEIALGYGAGKEVEQHYRNQGLQLWGKLYRFTDIDETLIASLDGSIATIYSRTDDHNHTTAFALSPAFRAYFSKPNQHTVRPYLQISLGPAYLSSRQLGNREQGAHFAFQTTLEAGTEIGTEKHSVDLNLRFIHYCNAGIFHPNEGINLAPVISIGYQF